MKIGARVFKTGLSVTLSIIISLFLIPDNSPSLAAIAALTTTMPTVKSSIDMLKRRLLANTIGGIIAVIMLTLIGSNPLTIGLTIIILIGILNAINLSDVLSLAGITTMIVMLSQSNSYIIAAIFRVLETVIGVLVAFIVNWMILPPRHDKPFYNSLISLTHETHIFIRASLRKNTSFVLMNKDLNWVHNEFENIDKLFELMRNEIIFSKQEQMIQIRRLVIYRHMRRATREAIRLLTILHTNDDTFQSFPDELRSRLRRRIETLMGGHEQIIMKFSGRVSAEEVRYLKLKKEAKLNLFDDLFDLARQNILTDESTLIENHGVIHIISAVYSYEESLIKLNDLIRIYKQRYKENYSDDEKLAQEHFV